MVDLKAQLNEAQLSAVNTVNGPVLVIAGAGSGKTRVIEYRVLRLVEEGVDPSSILLLTFTREAARRMLERAAGHDRRCSRVEGGTFHSFGYRLLRRYYASAGLPENFSVMDEDDAGEAIKRCMDRSVQDKRFPKKDTVRSIISACVNRSLSVEEVLAGDYRHFLPFSGEISSLRSRYCDFKRKNGYVDYDDILVLMKALLEKEEVRASFISSYRFVMVDEFQDTNRLQGEITRLLAEPHGNVMVVGDDAQSIYGFRGASHRNIMKFSEVYRGCKIVKLQDNYRSTQPILDLANSVLRSMENKYDKSLVSAHSRDGERPAFFMFGDAYDEACWLASRLEEALAAGQNPGEQAVLFRSAYVSIPLQAELGRRRVAFRVFGGMKFYEAAHIKDAVCLFRLAHNPSDELAWRRVLKMNDGVGEKTSERVISEIRHCRGGMRVYASILRSGKFKGGLKSALEKLAFFLEKASSEPDLALRFDMILEYYAPFFRDRFDDWHLRNGDFTALREIVAHSASADELLASLAIDPPQQCEERGGIVLSTIHSAKGLEWDNVYLIGMQDGVFPSGFSFEKPEEMEEEQRLFYVAITRARGRLILTFHRENARNLLTPFNRVSRFLELPGVADSIDKEDVFSWNSAGRRGRGAYPGCGGEGEALDDRMFDFLDGEV
ncbi:MAG: ATP-dependent helicase [Elusimicrobia bacterium]|nr:ATP-dependent helicase [Elusimicrobiota bacterium]